MTDGIPSIALPSAADDLATRSDLKSRAALRLLLPLIPDDRSFSSTVFCVPDCFKSFQITIVISSHGVRRPTTKSVARDPFCSRPRSHEDIGKEGFFLGGRTRARTWDPLIKSQLLYQLSYAPGTSPETATARGRRLAKRPLDVQQACGLFAGNRHPGK
jgi:hypothetical protein